jgi:predicted nuclease of restriction endonuclease-like RecB superfamily
VDTANPELLDLGERLLAPFRADPALTRGEIDERTGPVVQGARDTRLAGGLLKLLVDRSEFDHREDLDFVQARQTVFAAGARLLRQGQLGKAEAFRGEVRRVAAADLPPDFDLDMLYGDLAEFEHLSRFRDLTPQQLLERYNVGLVQALLLRSSALELTVRNPDPARLRRLVKYLKFFRLVARIEPLEGDDETAGVQVRVDGPASLFAQTRRYGLQLASFFPSVCALETWRLTAEVEWKRTTRELVVDQSLGLVCHYRNFSAYVPEEVRLFHRHFRETVEDWQIVGNTPFIQAGGQQLVFPDLSFADAQGRVLHLELFHRWHRGQAEQRLELLRTRPQTPLILGIDRALAEAPPLDTILTEESPLVDTRVFLFRDYPTVNRARKCLDAAVAEVFTRESPG